VSDLVNYICQRAAFRFGGSDGVFNAAVFSTVWSEITGLKNGLDGLAVRAMLHGRPDVESNGSHFRLVPKETP
jgi:hypothetical protein